MKNRRWIAGGLVMALLSGCAAPSVDYVDDTTGTAIQVNTTNDGTTGTAESQKVWDDDQLDGREWKERFDIETASGSRVTFQIDATISAPQEKNTMSVYEFEVVRNMTTEEKEDYLRTLYDDGKVYMAGDAYRTKAMYQRIVEMYEAWIKKETNKETVDIYREIIADYEEKMLTAPEELVPATDFSGNQFLGYIDGKPFSLQFVIIEDGVTLYTQYTDENSIHFQQGQHFTSPVTIMLDYEDLDGFDHLMDTMEERIAETEKVVRRAMAFFGREIGASDARSPYLGHGYNSCYTQGPGCFERGTLYQTKRKGVLDTGGNVEIPMKVLGNSAHALVLEEWGAESISIRSPYREKDVRGDVDLLPFDTIVEVVKNELHEHADEYHSSRSNLCKYTKMKRGYIEVIDEQQENVSMVPCWCLEASEDGLFAASVFVNAIDGSVIHTIDKISNGAVEDYWW